ncbi:hypothetical protein B0H16DRAFT_1746638 [Mycena metata]|uniref:Uncharacterized protein n=1 Tax=Mycena metata TaxID=1033252 RepID=A0AAD7GWV2_9AGAR|nr:hypothetical protein B0H16DRAFT_1746638 [Mycena metata]
MSSSPQTEIAPDQSSIPWWLRKSPPRDLKFTEFGSPTPQFDSPSLVLTRWWHDKRKLKNNFLEQYPLNHPERLTYDPLFQRDHDRLSARLVCAHAIYVYRTVIHRNTVASETVFLQAMSELTTTDYLSAWLTVEPWTILDWGVGWGSGWDSGRNVQVHESVESQSKVFGTWGSTDTSDIATNGWELVSGWGPAPVVDDSAWGTGDGWPVTVQHRRCKGRARPLP